MDVQLPDGTTLKGIPDGTTKSQIAEKLKASGHAVPEDWTKPQPLKKPGEGYTLAEHADIAASVVSGAGAALVGGIAKAGAYANQAVGLDKVLGTDKQDPAHAGDWFEEHLTYSPRTKAGKAVIGDVQKGMKAFEDWSEKQGQGATDAIMAAKHGGAEIAKALGAPQSVVDFIETHGRELAAGYGAATKTAINAVPLVIGDAAGRALKAPARAPGVGEVAEAPKPAPQTPPPAAPPADLTLAPSPQRAAPGAPPAAAAAPAPPLTAAPAPPRGTPTHIGEGPEPLGPPPLSPKARAQAYARDRLGVAWDDLAERTQRKLELVAKDAQSLDRLNPEAVKRQAKLEALRVPIKTTAGRLTRDDAQLIKEEGAAGTTAGRPIREIDIAANRDLRRNVEVLVDRLRGVGQSRAGAVRGEKLGEGITGKDPDAPGVLTKRQQQGQKAVNAAYETARKTEPNAKVSPDPLYEFVRGNPEVLNPQIQHLSWLQGWLKKAGIESEGVEGEAAAKRPIRLAELDDLRKKAVSLAKAGGTDGHYAGEVLKAIDKTFEEVPDAAKAWKQARKLHSEQQAEFTNQQAIQRLVGTKGGPYGKDPKTALEDVWKVSIKNARLEEVRQLKRSLLAGKDAETRLQGKQALRSLRAATAQNLLDEIQKGVSTNEAGEVHITADGINRWIKSMGQDGTVEGGVEKLQAVFGRKATRELMDIREAAQITKTAPTTRVSGSNTFQNILNWIDDTGLGDTVKGLLGTPVNLAEKAWKMGESGRVARAAAKDATSAGEKVGTKLELRDLERQLQGRRPPPPTYGDRE
jgi:hypothetical protein